MNYYRYNELRDRAITGTQEDVDDGLKLWPVYGGTEDEPMIVGYELR